MIQLVYESVATPQFEDSEVFDIVDVARRFNPDHDITGLLIYHDRAFVQVLEGPQEAVEALYEHIGTDPRHDDVWRLACMDVQERSFAHWSMGLVHTENLPEKIASNVRSFRDVTRRMRQLHNNDPDGEGAYTARLIEGFLAQFSDLDAGAAGGEKLQNKMETSL
jgi:hypothetical protein